MEKLLIEIKQYRKEQAELLDWNKHNGHPVTVSFDEGGLNACDKIIAIIERARAKSDSTSEKDLRVCDVNGWLLCSESLPEAKQYKSGIIPNEDLVIIKLDKHDSYEFAVLKQSQFGLIWEIPDHGYAEMSEVSKWKHF